MSKSSPRLKQLPIDENEWLDHPFVQWIFLHKQKILWAIAALLAFMIIAYRWTSNRTIQSEVQYFQAESLYKKFQDQSLNSQQWESSLTQLSQLSAIMDQYPDLQAKYDGPIAQTLIIEKNAAQARPFAERTFRRTSTNQLSLYQDFAQTSLLIAAGQYEEALKQAQQLREKMDEDDSFYGETLYVFNLVRIGMLAQQLGKTQSELVAWEDLQQYADDPNALTAVYSLFNEGNTSLGDYVEMRRQILQP